MTTSSISFLARHNAQTQRLQDMRAQLADLQRQIATQKKTDTLSGHGSDATRVQRLRAERSQATSFIQNIDVVNTRATLMSDAMTQAAEIARQVLDGIALQTREGEVEISTINTIANENLKFLRDLLNTKEGDRYLFSGSDTANAPHDDLLGLNGNFQGEISDWLSGGQSLNQMLADMNGFTPADLGYASSLSTAGSVKAHVDFNLEVDYTVRADSQGFTDIMKGLALAANLDYPDPSVDVGTESEFHAALDEVNALLSSGVKAVETDAFNLNTKISFMQSVQDRHVQDEQTFTTLISGIEDVDTAEVISKLQALDNQLVASYETTSIVNQLSLVNFL